MKYTQKSFWLPDNTFSTDFGGLFLHRHHEVHICGFAINVFTTIRWIVLKFVPLRMNCNNSGDPLTFTKASSSQNFV